MADKIRTCSVENCNDSADKVAGGRRGWCCAHYNKFLKYGDPLLGINYCRTHDEICSISGCSKPHYGRGWCKSHYEQWRKWGDPVFDAYFENGPRKFIRDVVLKFDKQECLVWPFVRNHEGYGQMRHGDKIVMANHIICEAAHGPKPSPDHESAHSCGRGSSGCCSPIHLRWATKEENEADKILHGTTNRGEANGHAKLTVDQVRKIRSLEGTMLQREIGELFDVKAGTISNILAKKAWAWLD